jgi:primosomal protein N' (replication factor Y)
LRNTLAQVNRREIDILVGTQMVTKGHDFPYVTLVGVICADLGLHLPDFRAAERTFQLLTQVAGRAGRGKHAGRVIIQTYCPDHPSLIAARTHDYVSFYKQEILQRGELDYPPSAYLAAFRIDGTDPAGVAKRAMHLAGHARRSIKQLPAVSILGPAEAPIQKLKGRTRWLLLLKSRSRPQLRKVIDAILADKSIDKNGGIRVSVDIDPISML